MTKLLLSAAGLASLVAGMTALPSPSFAQNQTLGEIIVYGTDPCPRSTDDQVVICRRLPEGMRYRLPQDLRPSGTRQQKQSWANKAQEVRNLGATGTGSCSAVGPGGHTGCLVQEIQRSRAAQQEDTEANTAPER